ncbi:DUF1643 domain-containing protein [Turicibacter sanguinis]|nr:DUF1643 domain-containing protein [Turicibacter sanguinis]MTP47962.1 DUF1643 domain-containing protein [Turicibacter sanguinis]MTP50710.1 DUF1643 domain-containing protein [Turicibacter sanguinis]MTQ07946.1 DUF1643 domain-containing protein [Turicibacter sanguinis]
MSVVERRGGIRSEAVFNDDYTHRYILRKEWDKERKKAVVIMIQPNTNDPYDLDLTTIRVINNLHRNGYGYVDIVNLYSLVAPKLSFKGNEGELVDTETNDGYIIRSCSKTDTIILAYGSITETYKKVADRANQLLEKLKPFQDKIYFLADNHVKVLRHPLAPTVANSWRLVKAFSE